MNYLTCPKMTGMTTVTQRLENMLVKGTDAEDPTCERFDKKIKIITM